MRRKDKEIALRSEMDEIIEAARVCRLAMVDGSRPYIVPLSFGYDGRALYFHSARTGKKIDLLRRGKEVCFELETAVAAAPADAPCKWGMAYRSIIGYGTVEFMYDPEARRRALDLIMAHYSDASSFTYTDAELRSVSVFRVIILEMSGKRSGRARRGGGGLQDTPEKTEMDTRGDLDMPVYEYEHTEASCEVGRAFEIRQSINDAPLTACPVCGGGVRKLISRVAVSMPKGNAQLKDLGFTKLVRRDDGVYENVTRRDGENRYMVRGKPETLPDVSRILRD